MHTGGCRCGAVRYDAGSEIAHHALCHCRDCQMAHGAPVVGWIAFKSAGYRLTKGEPVSYEGEGGSIRSFCGTCGTPLSFVNENVLPGLVDIPSVTLDEPDAGEPSVQIQVAERRKWMEKLAEMPEFDRFPGE